MDSASGVHRQSTSSTAAPRARSLSPVFWWLWAGNLLSALAMFVLPFLAMYLTSRGLRPSRVGLVVSCFSVGALLAGPAAGSLADALGRRRTLLLALVGSAASAASPSRHHRRKAVNPARPRSSSSVAKEAGTSMWRCGAPECSAPRAWR